MSAVLVCGIDVGLASAAASVYGYANGRNYPALIKTTMIRTVGEAASKRIDVHWFSEWLITSGATKAYVENATAMPAPQIDPKTGQRRQMGAGGMARYLRAAGAIETCAALAGLEPVLVMPGKWQAAVGLTAFRRSLPAKEQDHASVLLARMLFPDHAATTFKFWNSHNESDSSLIALYAAARCDLVTLQAAA